MTALLRRLLVLGTALALLAGAPAAAATGADPDDAGGQAPAADTTDGATAGDAGDAGDDGDGSTTPAAKDDTTAPATGGDPLGPQIDVPIGPYGMPFVDFGGPPQPAFVGSGTDALIRAPKLRNGNEPTLYERFGSQGYSLGSTSDPVAGDGALNSVAATIFATAMWLAQAVVAAVQWSFSLEFFDFLGDAVTPLVQAIRGVVYSPFVTTAIVLAGLWLVWHGLIRRRTTLAFEGMAWTVAALAVGAAFLASPATILETTSELGTGISRSALGAVSRIDPGAGPDDGTQTQPTFDGNRADAQLRLAGDRFWRVFIHQPWTVMQFGDTATGERYGERLLAARTISPEEYEGVKGDEDAMAALVEAKQAEYTALSEEIVTDPRSAEWFRGRRSVERVGLASLTLAGVAVGGILLLVVAAAIVLAQVAVALLVLVGPVALLLGIHPGTGRVIAVRWAQLAVGLLVKRVALGVLLAVVLVVNGIVLDATYSAGWFVTMGLQTLLVAAVVVYRKPFLRLVGPTTVPVLHRAATAPRAPAAPAGATASASASGHGPITAVTHTLGRSGGQRRRQSNALQRAVPRPHLPVTRPPQDSEPMATPLGPARRRAARTASAGGPPATGDGDESSQR